MKFYEAYVNWVIPFVGPQVRFDVTFFASMKIFA